MEGKTQLKDYTSTGKIKLIGLSGRARSGKDSFCKILKNHLSSEHNVVCKRFAFADQLKYKISDFIFDNLGFSVFTEDNNQKQILRPLLVAYGCAMRRLTDGRYWVDQIESSIIESYKAVSKNKDVTFIAIITDVRFCEYKTDEVQWIRDNGGQLFYIERFLDDGSQVPFGSLEEEVMDPGLRESADATFSWKSHGNSDEAKAKNFQKAVDFLSNNLKI